MPWKLSEDLKNFKKITMGHYIVMGRNTFESIGKALPGRTNIILSRDKNYKAPGCLTVGSLKEAINLAKDRGENELMIIGGGQVYIDGLKIANRIYLSQVEYSGPGDTYFPEFNESDWKVISEVKYENDSIPWTFKVLER